MANDKASGGGLGILAVIALAAGCGGQLPVPHETPPPGSWDAAVYQVRFDDVLEPVQGAAVSRSFFDTPGIRPMMGRLFADHEYAAPPSRVVLIAHALWVERFDSSPGVIGREIEVDGAPVVVVGVLPAGFSFPDGSGLWVPRVAVSHAGWTVRSDASDSEIRALARRAVDDVGRALAALRPFPRPVTVRLARCGDAAQAVWLDDAGEILLCDELLSHALTFADEPLPVVRYIVAHEVGHASADLFGIPATGSGEFDADQFAAVLLTAGGLQADVVAAAMMMRRMAEQPDLLEVTRRERLSRSDALMCLVDETHAAAEPRCRTTLRDARARWHAALS
jgi:hypothetical protein